MSPTARWAHAAPHRRTARKPSIKDFDKKFPADGEYKYKSSHNRPCKGYSGMYVVKALTEKHQEGRQQGVDQRRAYEGATVSAQDDPGVLLDVVTFDKRDLDREESFLSKRRERQEGSNGDVPPASTK